MNSTKGITGQLIDFLASVKLALAVLIGLAAAAVGGTVIPQNLPPEQYYQGLGPQLYTFLSYLDMFDMYHSWWFNTLLALLLLNLVVCSLKRLPQTLRLAAPTDGSRIKVDFLKKQSFSHENVLRKPTAALLPGLREALGRRFGRPKETKTAWGTLLWAEKGAFARFGAYVVHFSIFFIVAGGVVGNTSGFEAFLSLNEGQTASEVLDRREHAHIVLPFAIRLDRFTIKFYDNGTPSEYRSEVTVLENGVEVRREDIRVNHPLTYRGVTFYQSSYGSTLGDGLRLRLVRQSDQKTFDLQVPSEAPTELPEGMGTIQVLDFADNLMNTGPAVRLLIHPAGGEAYTDWAMAQRPSFLPASPGPLTATLLEHKKVYYTGLQVNRDPGVWLIWLGCGLMLLGFLITFFFAHRKIFIALVPQGEQTRIVVAGSSHRNPGSFRIKFDGLVADLGQPAASGKEDA